MHDQDTVRALYRRLLALYPRGFRAQFRESMEQTFNDLCNERKRQKTGELSSFVLWTFAETALGIVREYIHLVSDGAARKSVLTNLRSPAIISFVLVLPFMLLELVNRRNYHEGFPVTLFGVMWLLPVAFILISMPIMRNVRAGNSIIAHPITLLLRVVLLALIAIVWTGTVIDQLPCFMGVPLCD